jgi:putative mRNA 3-end processing factor
MPHPHLSDSIPKWQQGQFRDGRGPADSRDLVVLRPEGLYCPAGDFHIDPWLPVPRAVITHGHGDHARLGMGEYHAVREGLPILRWRLGEQRYVAREYGEDFMLGAARVSLHPAGHVLGSAQVRIEVDGAVWVVSGDYKRQPDPTCAPFQVVRCDTFITEATFGLPVYRWPETGDVAREIVDWRDQCGTRGETAVLFCYALGKAQRLLGELSPLTDRPALLHGTIAAGVQVYRDCGIAMLATQPVSEPWSKRDYAGELVLAPPSAAGSPWMRRFRRTHSTGSPRAGCASVATAAGATTIAASSCPTTPTGRRWSIRSATPAPRA